MQSTKGQSTFEFLILVGIGLVAVTVFSALSLNDLISLQTKKETFLVRDTAAQLQNEIILAAVVEDGYSRSFEVPSTLNGVEYNVTIINNVLDVWTERTSSTLAVPTVQGNFSKGGLNNISKVGGVVFLNE